MGQPYAENQSFFIQRAFARIRISDHDMRENRSTGRFCGYSNNMERSHTGDRAPYRFKNKFSFAADDRD